jgi:hypothetical protein
MSPKRQVRRAPKPPEKAAAAFSLLLCSYASIAQVALTILSSASGTRALYQPRLVLS